MKKIKDLTNKKFGNLSVIKLDAVKKGTGANWLCKCGCGNTKSIIGAKLTFGDIKSCGCLSKVSGGKRNWRGFGQISGEYFGNIKRNALKKNRDFDLTIEQVWDLFLKQEKKCSLTRLPLTFATTRQQRKGQEQTASLDRIDSSKGYTTDNVQWIHKTVNQMKSDLSQQKFIEFCRLIAKETEDGTDSN